VLNGFGETAPLRSRLSNSRVDFAGLTEPRPSGSGLCQSGIPKPVKHPRIPLGAPRLSCRCYATCSAFR
jgi:hypothetical protein